MSTVCFSLSACLCVRTSVTFDLRYLLPRDTIAPKRENLNTWKRVRIPVFGLKVSEHQPLFLNVHLGFLRQRVNPTDEQPLRT